MSETGNGRKNWTRVVAAVGLVFLAVAGGIVLANANKVINKTEKKDEETPLIRWTGHQCWCSYGGCSSCMLPDPFRWRGIC